MAGHEKQRNCKVETCEPLILMSASIQGTDAGEWISGDGDDNFIEAFGGNDEIYAPLGENVVDGGSGFDTFVIYEGNKDDFDIQKTADGIVFIEGPGLNGQVNRNELRNMESILFLDGRIDVSDIPVGTDPVDPDPVDPDPVDPDPVDPDPVDPDPVDPDPVDPDPVDPDPSATITGTNGDDWISGSEADDVIDAGAGNDNIYAPIGDNIIYGGGGEDALIIYEGVSSQYDVTRYASGVVEITGPGLNGLSVTNILVGVEQIHLNDGAIDVSTLPVTPGDGPLPVDPDPVDPDPVDPDPVPVPGTIGLTLDTLTINEDLGQLTFVVFRADGADGEVTVDYTTANGQADSSDYEAISGTLVFANGVTGQQLTIDILDDDVPESAETFSLILSNPTGGATLSGITTQTVTIEDNDDVTTGIIFADSFDESTTWITNSQGTDTATTGQWAVGSPQETTSGSDILQFGSGHTGSRALVTGLASGSSVGAFDVDNGITTVRSREIVLPNADEIELSFAYNLAYLANATSDDFFHVAIISNGVDNELYSDHAHNAVQAAQWRDTSLDISEYAGQTIQIQFEVADAGTGSLIEAAVDDVVIQVLPNLPGTISVTTTGVNIDESAGTAEVVIQRHTGRHGTVTVDYATIAGSADSSDFSPVSGTLTFLDGESEATVIIPISEDNIDEDLESFTLQLSNPTAGAELDDHNSASITIVDNDNTVADYLPDLTPIRSTLSEQLSVDTSEQPGRRLLRFSTEVANAGDGPLEIWGGSSSGTSQQVFQRIYQADGGSRDALAGEFVYHPGHGHIHLEGFATYNLRLVDGNGNIVASGGKTSFCLINIRQPFPDVTNNAGLVHGRGGDSCGQVQGISAGYSDVYSASLDDQWIDITNINPGTYWLEVETDPENHIQETDETNNLVRMQVTVNADGSVSSNG